MANVGNDAEGTQPISVTCSKGVRALGGPDSGRAVDGIESPTFAPVNFPTLVGEIGYATWESAPGLPSEDRGVGCLVDLGRPPAPTLGCRALGVASDG